MMRAFFITMCVFALIYTVVTFAITTQVSSDRSMAYWESYSSYDSYSDDYYTDSYNYDYADSYEQDAEDGTQRGGIISVVFMLFSAGTFLMALMKIKTKTMKVISIIGLSLAGLFMLWGFLPMTSPSGVSFDEVGPAFGLAGLAILGLDIVGMVHAFKTKT